MACRAQRRTLRREPLPRSRAAIILIAHAGCRLPLHYATMLHFAAAAASLRHYDFARFRLL